MPSDLLRPPHLHWRRVALASALASTAWVSAFAAAPMDESLRAVLAAHAAAPGVALERAQSDAQGRLLVEVVVQDAQVLAPMRRSAAESGARVLSALPTSSGTGHQVLTVAVPPGAIAALAQVPGVRALHLVQPAILNAGPALSQAVAVLHAKEVQDSGYTGKGITVAVLSDSYSKITKGVTAQQDVLAGELPGVGNPFGRTQPVVVLEDGPDGATDEGRAMLQLVHDIAPDAKLCFAQGVTGSGPFANAVRALADKSGPCAADVIIDDISFYNSPVFADGEASLAVDEVVAQGVSYFSCAGNRSATDGMMQDFAPVANTVARGAPNSPVDLSLIPAADTSGGFHNFAPAGKPVDIARSLTIDAQTTIMLQWNDPFDAGGITTDYDVYIFSEDGKTLVGKSTNINAETDRPFEFFPIGNRNMYGDKVYQIVIARRGNSPATPVASRLRYMLEGNVQDTEYPDFKTALVYGHNAARTGNSVGAAPWFATDQVEAFSGTGPSYIYFDAQGRRLAKPKVRQKPDFLAPEDTNTSFFGLPSVEDTDKFPNFLGTSAAAPNAGAVAALMLEKAGGKGSLTPARVTRLLKESAAPHDLSPSQASATATSGAVSVRFDAVGNGQMPGNRNPNAFTVQMAAPTGYTLASLTLDMTNANASRVKLGVPRPGVAFNPQLTKDNWWGQPPVVGDAVGIAPADVKFSKLPVKKPLSKRLTLTFAAGKFTPESVLRFGVGHEEAASGFNYSVDLMEGGTLSAVVKNAAGKKQTLTATLAKTTGTGWTMVDGWGLIDAQRAVDAIKP